MCSYAGNFDFELTPVMQEIYVMDTSPLRLTEKDAKTLNFINKRVREADKGAYTNEVRTVYFHIDTLRRLQTLAGYSPRYLLSWNTVRKELQAKYPVDTNEIRHELALVRARLDKAKAQAEAKKRIAQRKEKSND